MSCLFNSYDPYFKQPFGAVRAGQTVHLALCIPEELGYVDPHLVIQKEGKYDVPVHYRMKFDGQTPKQNHFSVDVTLGDVGLYFYYFDLYTDFRRIFRGPDNCGVVSWQEGESWQLTDAGLHQGQGVLPDLPGPLLRGRGEQAHALPGPALSGR